MKAQYLKSVEEALRNHILDALVFLYRAASVGDNHLELGENTVDYSDGAVYTIKSLDMQFDANSQPVIMCIQEEEDSDETDEIAASGMPIETLIEVLEAVETVVNWHYDALIELPVNEG